MAIIRREISVEYDTSNKTYMITMPMLHHYDMSCDVPKWTTPFEYAFTTRGGAMAYFATWADGEWKLVDNRFWTLNLKEYPGGAYMVTLYQTILTHK